MTALPIPLRSNPGTYKISGSPRLYNCYASPLGADSKAPYELLACPGLTALGSDAPGNAPCRGMIWLEEDTKLYAVFGYFLYSVATDGTKTQLHLVGGTGPVYFARNDAVDTQVLLVTNEGKIFSIVDGTVTLEQYQDTDGNYIFQDADGNDATVKGVTSCGGYFVFWLEGGRFYASELQSTTVDALRFATAESDPDGLTKAHGQGNTLYLIGTQSVEVWAVSGGGDFPFSRVQGAQLNFGSNSPHAITDVDQSIALVCSDNTVRVIRAYNAQEISTTAISDLIEAETDKSQIYGFTYTKGRNRFYCLQGTTWTREYNFATGFWHDRYSYLDQPWKGAFYARAFNKDIFGSREIGRTFTGTYDSFLDDGDPQIWGFDSMVVHAYPDALEISNLYLEMETGQGPTRSTEGEVMVKASKDNGRSYVEKKRGLGNLGQYGKKVRLGRWGTSKQHGFMFSVRVSDPVVRGITQIEMDARQVVMR